MSEHREEMDKAMRDSIKQLAHVRGVRFVDAAIAIAESYSENLADSRETSMEEYWRAMSSVADSIVAKETGSWLGS